MKSVDDGVQPNTLSTILTNNDDILESY